MIAALNMSWGEKNKLARDIQKSLNEGGGEYYIEGQIMKMSIKDQIVLYEALDYYIRATGYS